MLQNLSKIIEPSIKRGKEREGGGLVTCEPDLRT